MTASNKPEIVEPGDLSGWELRTIKRTQPQVKDEFLALSRAIVHAAYDLLEEKGLEGLTIRAVLTKTGLARRAFYEHFAGKDDLVLAVFEYTIQLAATLYSKQLQGIDNPLERLQWLVVSIVLGRGSLESGYQESVSRRGAAMSREQIRLAESRPEELKAALSPLVSLLEDQVRAAQTVGLVRSSDPTRMANMVYNLVATTVHTELTAEITRPNRVPRMQLAEELWEFCRRAIAT
ncbi:helix-turn-helix domain-containing protein [Halioxenophilus sp. WMMB6]|uniref:TetR/AcrR family transcriptional regulator n=1 Tax=Halioxenophilus sp. WMMB6 TaxID=3073815 RepID=UPI00295EA51A|nr:helix-turn-helix domain-containing protein [Halioxenophilus sp. WMMB6]